MKIKLSKSQWNFIGKTTGWLRVSSSTMVYHASSDDNSMKIKLSKNHWKWIGKKAGWTDGVNKPPLNPQPTNTTPTNTTPTNTDPSNTAPENTEARVGKALGSRYHTLKMGDKDKGIKWIVLNQGGKRQVQDAYIDMSNQYIENGKVLGKFEENGNIRGKTGIFLNSMNEKPPMPKLSYFLNNHIGKIS